MQQRPTGWIDPGLSFYGAHTLPDEPEVAPAYLNIYHNYCCGYFTVVTSRWPVLIIELQGFAPTTVPRVHGAELCGLRLSSEVVLQCISTIYASGDTNTHAHKQHIENAREASQTCSSPSSCKKTWWFVMEKERDEREMVEKKGVKEIQRARYEQWKNSRVHRTDW